MSGGLSGNILPFACSQNGRNELRRRRRRRSLHKSEDQKYKSKKKKKKKKKKIYLIVKNLRANACYSFIVVLYQKHSNKSKDNVLLLKKKKTMLRWVLRIKCKTYLRICFFYSFPCFMYFVEM